MFPPNKDDPPLAVVFPKTEAPNVGLMLEFSSLLLEENIPEGFGFSEELPAKIEAEFVEVEPPNTEEGEAVNKFPAGLKGVVLADPPKIDVVVEEAPPKIEGLGDPPKMEAEDCEG